MAKAARTISGEDWTNPKPIYAVWELTLKCDQACRHCGSRAGPEREHELTTSEALRVVEQLAKAGTRECTLIGGEAYLRDDYLEVIRALKAAGIRPTMQSGGRNIDLARAKAMKEAGLVGLGISIDGIGAVHETLRAVPGGYAACLRALDAGREAGLIITSNIQINRLNKGQLSELADILYEKGVRVWQVQATVPMGRAADHPDWILQPWEMLEVVDTLAAIQERMLKKGDKRPFDVFAGNNIGYFGPHELLLRSRPGVGPRHWKGCRAGQQVLGIESDGAVKGCPSLPTAPYIDGNLLTDDLADLWQNSATIGFTRDRGTEELWGFCKTCYYADECRAGCSFTAHALLGRRGNNPLCYFRADTLRKKGLRERIVQVQQAPGDPYDIGRFEIVEEPWVVPSPPG